MTIRRPLIGIAIAVSVGMVFGSLDVLAAAFVYALAAIVLFFAWTLRTTDWSDALTLLTIALVSAARFLVAIPDLASDSINNAIQVGGEDEVEIVGHVSSQPEFNAYPAATAGTLMFPLRCEHLSRSNEWRSASGEVDVRIIGASAELDLMSGQRVKVSGRIEKKLFPGRNGLELRGSLVERAPAEPRWSPRGWGEGARRKAATRLEAGMSGFPVQEAVLKALVLGYREEMPDDVMGRFRRTGALHVFAISGLHVGIVGLLLAIALKALGVRRDRFWMFLIPLLTVYVISTGMKSSALRALTMAVVFMLAPIFHRKPDIPTSVAIAAIVLLLFQPLEILSAGFVFSFTVVVFIVMVYSVAPSRWVEGGWFKRYGASLLITSFAASLASLPLAALYFGMFSPIALVGNLIVVPLTFCVVLCGWLSIIAPIASAIFNHAAVVFIDLLLGSVSLLDAVPGSSWRVSPPSPWAVALWFGGLIYLFTHADSKRRRWTGLAGAGGAVVLALLG